MKTIRISDRTLATDFHNENVSFTFREKIEVSKLLDRLFVSVIELGDLSDSTADTLLIESVALSVKDATVAVGIGLDAGKADAVWEPLKHAAHPRLQVCAAASTARMEYVYHKKGEKMLGSVGQAVAACRALCADVEFIAEDATRADFGFLCEMLDAAVQNGATTITVCDTAGTMLPDEFGTFVGKLRAHLGGAQPVSLGVRCSDHLEVANACAIEAVKNGADEIKVTAIAGDSISVSGIAKLIAAKAGCLQANFLLRTTEINRVLGEIEKLSAKNGGGSPFEDGVRGYADTSFSKADSPERIAAAVRRLGYTLDESDRTRVWKAFCDAARRKDFVSEAELDAIVASEATQVPPTYTLESFVVTTSNTVDILAHIKLRKGDRLLDGLSLGDGPIDAAFLAIEKITGHHYELDDFQLQAVTEGREAMGQTIVKLRSGGKIYSGKGISTDIIGSGVAAYINALNKIIYEEENA